MHAGGRPDTLAFETLDDPSTTILADGAGVVKVRTQTVRDRVKGMRTWSVGTSSATNESRAEPDGSSSCPTPSPPSRLRSYAEVDVGEPTIHGSGSLVRSRSEVNFRRSC